ncbi:MAG: hypothetical protein JO100_02805 [Pseudonocardia sp.]|nr:hypothetical protein [Pseudonocardia sp.]
MNDRRRFHHRARPDVAAVDHAAGSDRDVVPDDQVVIREQVQHGVFQDPHPGTNPDRAV